MKNNRIKNLKSLNCKLALLLPEIQKIRNEMAEHDELFTFYHQQFYKYCNLNFLKGLVRAEKEFKKIVKKLSTQLAKYSKINAQRKQYRIFVKCTQFSINF